MSQRFFLDPITHTERLVTGSSLLLQGDQAHHAINVMRFNPGDQIVLFDGTGVEYSALLETVEKKAISLSIIEAIENPTSLQTQIAIAVALPKGDRQKFLIEKLVELGVSTLIPLKTSRSVAVANAKVIVRLEKQVIEASKQCGRNKLMEIQQPHTIEQMVQSADEGVKLLTDPYQGKPIAEYSNQQGRQFTVAIGPEGGFDDSEVELMIANEFQPIRLGPAILRIETACVTIAAILGIGNE